MNIKNNLKELQELREEAIRLLKGIK